MIRILYFGDVVGRIGRLGLASIMPSLEKKYKPTLCIANVENLAHGYSVTKKTIEDLQEAGISFFTSGNHIWKKKEGIEIISASDPLVLRPENYPKMNPGTGHKVVTVGKYKILVINIMGRVFMKENINCPFEAVESVLKSYDPETLSAIFIDFHAEVTSEKKAMHAFVDGRVSGIVGSHTHVATADLEISSRGTAAITDAGMVGPKHSVIGHKTSQILERFLTQIEIMHEVEEEGPCLVNGVMIEIDPKTRKAVAIEQIIETVEI